MKLLKIGVPALLVALAVSAGAAYGQAAVGAGLSRPDDRAQRPRAPRPCYDPAGSRACQPGPAVDVVKLGAKLRARTTRVLRVHKATR